MATTPDDKKKKKKKLRGRQTKMLKGHLAKHGVSKGGQALRAKVVVGLAASDEPGTAAEVHFCSTIISAETTSTRGNSIEIAYDWDLRILLEGFPEMKFPAPAVMSAELAFRVSRSGKTVFVRPIGDVSFLAATANEDFTTPGSIEDYLKSRYGKDFDRRNSLQSAAALVKQHGYTIKMPMTMKREARLAA